MTRNCAIALLLMVLSGTAAAADRDWISVSNQQAAALLQVMAKYSPEDASAVGVEGHDGDVFDARPGNVEREEADLDTVIKGYERALPDATDARVQQDLAILLKSARDQRTTLDINHRLMLPYVDMPKVLFEGFHGLLDPRVSKERQRFAVIRLKRYVGTAQGYQPISQLLQARLQERSGDASLTGPWIVEIEQDLKNEQPYLKGIRDLFVKSGLGGWQGDFNRLRTQVEDYGKWVRATVVPKARQTHRLPAEVYADNLKQYGVTMAPDQLVDRALATFEQTREEMQSLAAQIAKDRGFSSPDYRDVMRELKKATIPNDRLIAVYRERLAGIEAIIRQHHLITLPHRQAAIRLATDAESAALPAPHLSIPRLIGNTGEPAEFVLPTSNPNADPKAKMDDFNYDAITWDLTAHEARPGHELQFAAMLERGVSVARAVFAFNSANVEGWALYAEAFTKQYMPPEAQLAALQMRLMRAARAFLDPMVNLGMMEPAAAKRVLMDEVVLSEPMAQEEIDRFTFTAPGQATSYFFGYSKLEALRARAQFGLGERFEEQTYHDFVINQGLLPLALLEQAVTESFVPAQQAKAAAH
ncbi:MAG TPA: DUF885 domain-containing protein [Steroidobacteraceae bacterium]|nr:DUF885 domain-containing protein [Steroidobacteraceae bacterium]